MEFSLSQGISFQFCSILIKIQLKSNTQLEALWVIGETLKETSAMAEEKEKHKLGRKFIEWTTVVWDI